MVAPFIQDFSIGNQPYLETDISLFHNNFLNSLINSESDAFSCDAKKSNKTTNGIVLLDVKLHIFGEKIRGYTHEDIFGGTLAEYKYNELFATLDKV